MISLNTDLGRDMRQYIIIQHFCRSDTIIINDLENIDNKNNQEVMGNSDGFSNTTFFTELFSLCNLTVVFNHWPELVKANSKILTTEKVWGLFYCPSFKWL